MKTDLYTKSVLTLIAVGLFLNVAADLIPVAYAYGSGAEVKVTNYETDISAGETLYVYCTNCN
jgi:hypothetical protein